MDFINQDLLDYVAQHSDKEPELLQKLNRETHQKILQPRMLSGSFQGRVLSLLSQLIQPSRILEVGTYTGYSALCLAEGLQNDGILHTIDCNEELVDFQKKYFDQSKYKNQIIQHLGNADQIIPRLEDSFDLVFLDADKENYPVYLELVAPKINSGGLLISDNVLWSGKVLEPVKKEDIATRELIRYNKLLKEDSRFQTVVLPIRDGLTLSRKI
ncbi:MAG: O-methyltransferase [Flavobacteriaceae bacterium]|nr:O-methyltransferase [Flavobacteriaceae bacterium]